MKAILLIPAFACCALALQAQSIDSITQFDLHGNNILAHIACTGELFTSSVPALHGAFIPHPDASGQGPSTMAGAGIWIGGIDAGGKLKLTVHTYGGGTSLAPSSFCSGPLDAAGNAYLADSLHWRRVFRVKGDQISAFLAALPSFAGNAPLAESLFPDIMGWPGHGNPHFLDVRGFNLPTDTGQPLAPFVDTDHDGVYDPLQGDYPAVQLASKQPFVPALITWSVFNDRLCEQQVTSPSAFPLEVQLTAWVFNCPDQPVLNNTVFTSYKVIYKNDTPLDSTFIGMWADMDIGCPDDDHIGCNPALHAFYAYNTDALDGTLGTNCSGTATFGDHAPVQSMTLLGQSLDKFIWYARGGTSLPNGMTDPSAPVEYYNYMNGHWRDGTPLTFGGSGYHPGTGGGTPTSYAFPGDPGDPTAWSMCSTGQPPADVRGLGTHFIGTFSFGHAEELTAAWTVHENIALPCSIGNTPGEIAGIRGQFDQSFANVCMPITGVSEQRPLSPELFPNPAIQQVTLRYGTLHVRELRLSGVDGRRMNMLRDLPEGGQIQIDVSALPTGVYGLEIVSDQGNFVRKLCVVR